MTPDARQQIEILEAHAAAIEARPSHEIVSRQAEKLLLPALRAGAAALSVLGVQQDEQEKASPLAHKLLDTEARLKATEQRLDSILNLFDCYAIPRHPLQSTKARIQRMYRAWNVPGADEALTEAGTVTPSTRELLRATLQPQPSSIPADPRGDDRGRSMPVSDREDNDEDGEIW